MRDRSIYPIPMEIPETAAVTSTSTVPAYTPRRFLDSAAKTFTARGKPTQIREVLKKPLDKCEKDAYNV